MKSSGVLTPFMGKVFLTMISQLLVTFLVVFALSKRHNQVASIGGWGYVGMFLLSLGLVMLISGTSLSMPVKFLLFTLFSVIFGVMMVPWAHRTNSRKVFIAALGGAVGIFLALFALGVLMTKWKIDLSWMGTVLLVALIGLIIASLFIIACGVTKTAHRVWLVIGLIVYALLIMYDTQMIMRRSFGGDYVSAAMAYYLDVLGVFMRLVDLQNHNG